MDLIIPRSSTVDGFICRSNLLIFIFSKLFCEIISSIDYMSFGSPHILKQRLITFKIFIKNYQQSYTKKTQKNDMRDDSHLFLDEFFNNFISFIKSSCFWNNFNIFSLFVSLIFHL
jgi:hypothetical protein